MESMFWGSHSLKHLDLSNFNTSKVTNITQMFCSCQQLETLNISNFNTLKVNEMCYMFYYCDALTSINVSSFLLVMYIQCFICLVIANV